MKLKQKMDGFFANVVFVQKKITATILLCMIIVVTLQIISRPLRISLRWTEEVGTYLLIWMTYIGSIGCIIKGEHMVVDLFLARYTPAQHRVARLIIDALIAIFCGIMLIFGIRLCMNPVIINGNTPALGISRVWIYASLPISMFFSELYTIYDLIVTIADILSGGKIRSDEEVSKKSYDMK